MPTTPNIPGQTSTMTPLPSPALTASPSSHSGTSTSAKPASGSSSSSSGSSKPTARKVGKYILGKTLGQGTFGKVKFATDTETGRSVAIKQMDKAKIRANNMGEQIKKEISIMKLIKHPSVIQLLEVLASATTIYIVLELVTGGELFDKIISEGNFSESEARHYYGQLIGGIAQCHSHSVCHRDLKPENLLLDADGNLKISDFGLSALSNDMAGDLLHTTCGTPNYVAPEVLMDKGYDGKAADIWSSGVILYVLLAGFLPFDETSMVELFRKIVKADFAYPSSLSPEAVHLLSIILNPDPEKRATIEQIKAHPWYRGITMEQAAIEAEEEAERERERAAQAQEQTSENGFAPSISLDELSGHKREPSAGTIPDGDMSQAITWLEDKAVKAASLPTASAASPSDLMRSLQLDMSSRGTASMSSTPTAPSLLSPKMGEASPGASPALGPYSSTHSANASPSGGSMQARRNKQQLDSDSDPLGLDEEEVEIKGPIPLNAFDLINMVGGAAMGRMFQRGSEKKVRTFTQFTTTLPLDQILAKLEDVLRIISETRHKLYPKQCIIKASRSTTRGKILGACQIYQMTPKLFMVEWRKMKVNTATHK
jgi:serine/threonine protein kinase